MRMHHLSASFTIMQRGLTSGTAASAAYLSGEDVEDERLGRTWRYTADRERVVASDIVLPAGAPSSFAQASVLWGQVETAEDQWALHRYRNSPDLAQHHIDTARVAIKGHMTLANELGHERAWEIVHEWAGKQAEDHRVAVQIALHDDGGKNLHFHFQMTAREVNPADGSFGRYIPFLRQKAELAEWEKDSREWLASRQNGELAAIGADVHVEHRSFLTMGLSIPVEKHRGPISEAIGVRGGKSTLENANADLRASRRSAIDQDPWQVVIFLARTQATFTEDDIVRTARRFAGEDQDIVSRLQAAVLTDQRLVSVGEDARGQRRYATTEYLATERQLFQSAGRLAGRDQHHGNVPRLEHRLVAAEMRQGWKFSAEQRQALDQLIGGADLTNVVGVAGAGKTTILAQARQEWQAAGFEVRGAALAGIAAENLQREAGIESRTLASLDLVWKKRDALQAAASSGDVRAQKFLDATRGSELGPKTVLVVDEAGMAGTETLARVLARAERNGAKVVLVGDPDQLSIGAGDAYRGLVERQGAARIATVVRQKDPEMRRVSEAFARGNAREALSFYKDSGRIRFADDRDAAKAALIEDYMARRAEDPSRSRLIIAGLNADVHDINHRVREAMKAEGLLSGGVMVPTGNGLLEYAVNDRIMFLANDKAIGVSNGSRGTIEAIQAIPDGNGFIVRSFAIRLEDGRQVSFRSDEFGQHQHAYAATVHRSQGQTVDEVFHLADRTMYSREQAYVGGTRHRHDYVLYAGKDDFRNFDALARAAGREPGRTLAGDFADNPEAKSPVHRYLAANDRVIHLKKDIDGRQAADPDKPIFKDVDWPTYKVALDDRKAAAMEIADNWKVHRFQCAPARVHKETIEQHAGRRIRPPTEKEIGAQQRVIAYKARADEARDLWNRIKVQAPGIRAKHHPAYGEFAKARDQRDALATEITKDGRLYGPAVKATEGVSWPAIRSQAKAAAERQATREMQSTMTPNQRDLDRKIGEYKADLHALALDLKRVRTEAKAAGQKPRHHPSFAAWQKHRDRLDSSAAVLISTAEGRQAVASAEAEKRLPIGEVSGAADRHDVRRMVLAYQDAERAGREASRDRVAQELHARLAQDRDAGRRTATAELRRAGLRKADLASHAIGETKPRQKMAHPIAGSQAVSATIESSRPAAKPGIARYLSRPGEPKPVSKQQARLLSGTAKLAADKMSLTAHSLTKAAIQRPAERDDDLSL